MTDTARDLLREAAPWVWNQIDAICERRGERGAPMLRDLAARIDAHLATSAPALRDTAEGSGYDREHNLEVTVGSLKRRLAAAEAVVEAARAVDAEDFDAEIVEVTSHALFLALVRLREALQAHDKTTTEGAKGFDPPPGSAEAAPTREDGVAPSVSTHDGCAGEDHGFTSDHICRL